MTELTLQFHGKRVDIEELLEQLSGIEGVDQATVTNVATPEPNMLDREPLNQFELVDVLIAFTINMASAYAYDQIRTAVKERAAAKGFSEVEPEDDETK